MFWIVLLAVLGIFLLLGGIGYQITAYKTYVLLLLAASPVVVLVWRRFTKDDNEDCE